MSKILTSAESDQLIQELCIELKGKIDGAGKNINSDCPWCGAKGKFGVYIGKEIGRKKKFASNCFKNGCGSRSIEPLLIQLGRLDLIPEDTHKVNEDLDVKKLFDKEDDLEVDDELFIVDLPDGFTETDEHDYLEERGFEDIDYEYFPVGTSPHFKFNGYVIFPVYDNGDVVGYVSRHEWSKKRLERYNKNAKKQDKYQILRYRNSTDNDFVKLLYNFDNVVDDETETVIIVEGIFDVISLTRTLNLYDNTRVAVVATFGKKISDTQIWKLQQKGVKNIIIGYDPDAVETIKEISLKLDKYFDCFIADLPDAEKDFDDMDFWEVFDVFRGHLKTPREYNLNKVQEGKLKI